MEFPRKPPTTKNSLQSKTTVQKRRFWSFFDQSDHCVQKKGLCTNLCTNCQKCCERVGSLLFGFEKFNRFVSKWTLKNYFQIHYNGELLFVFVIIFSWRLYAYYSFFISSSGCGSSSIRIQRSCPKHLIMCQLEMILSQTYYQSLDTIPDYPSIMKELLYLHPQSNRHLPTLKVQVKFLDSIPLCWYAK